ncbi:hypothetical protein [Aliarcobacter butzleri]|uniref:hypothetical protein n=1 Tax=Aliarcobacter butzleri TaxID=28197 RepID=UPI002648A6B6|nr:hypothetical protein [Aliarcobacter butzleri]
MFLLLILLFPTAIFTIYIQSELNNFAHIMISIGLRFLHSGDIFFMLYPNNYLMELKQANGFIALFKDFLGTFRVISWENLPVNIGYQTFEFHYNTNILTGPNARHNIFGLFYFGFAGAIVFSFLIGFLMSFIRNRIYKILKPTASNLTFYVLIALSINFLNQDPAGMAVGYFVSIIIFFTLIYAISYILYNISRKVVLK